MDNYNNPAREIKIDLTDLFWKLLMQWKAILLVCISMALIVPGIKYAKDSSEYKTALADKAAAAEQASKPAEERIAAALELLPAKDRDPVMFVVQQQELADDQQAYLNDSILMNIDPADQRTLTVSYLIKSDSGAVMKTLIDYYNAGLRNDDLMKSLGEVIDPDADIKYIYELVNADRSSYKPDPEYSGADSAIYSVSVVLPEDTDAEAVTGIVDSAISSLHNELDADVGSHSIRKETVEDCSLYNSYALKRKSDLLDYISTLNYNIKTAKSSLTAEQKAACEAITAIKRSADAADELADAADDDVPQAPGFSSKYALLGFILGAILYAGIYFLALILKKIVFSAATAQSYTGTRLLGEIYKLTEHKGLSWLMASKAVAKLRYREKLDADRQIESLASTISAVCSHHGTDKLTLLLSGVGAEFGDQIRQIAEKCGPAGSKKGIDVVNADEMDEDALNSVLNAVYVVSSVSGLDNLSSLMSLVKDYGVAPLGTVYLEKL